MAQTSRIDVDDVPYPAGTNANLVQKSFSWLGETRFAPLMRNNSHFPRNALDFENQLAHSAILPLYRIRKGLNFV